MEILRPQKNRIDLMEEALADLDRRWKEEGHTSIAFSSLNRGLRVILFNNKDPRNLLNECERAIKQSLAVSLGELRLSADLDITLDKLWGSSKIRGFWQSLVQEITPYKEKRIKGNKDLEQAEISTEITAFIVENYTDAFFLGLKEVVSDNIEKAKEETGDERTQDTESAPSAFLLRAPQWDGGVTAKPKNGGHPSEPRPRSHAPVATRPAHPSSRTDFFAMPVPAPGPARSAQARPAHAARPSEAPRSAPVPRSAPAPAGAPKELPDALHYARNRMIAVLAISGALIGTICICGGVGGSAAAMSCNPTTGPHSPEESDPSSGQE